MSAIMARLSLIGGRTVNPTKLKEGLDFEECDRGAIATELQERGLMARVERGLVDSSEQLSSWVESLPDERPADGPGLIAGDCALVKMWTTCGQELGEEVEQAIMLSKFGAVSGSAGLLIVTPNCPMYRALIGNAVGDTVSWQGGDGVENVTVLATLWLPEIMEYQETSASGEV